MAQTGKQDVFLWSGTRAASLGITPAVAEPINITDDVNHVRVGDGATASGHRVGLLSENDQALNGAVVNLALGVWTHVPQCDVTLPRAGDYLVTVRPYNSHATNKAPRAVYEVRSRLRNNTLNSSYASPEGPRFTRTENDAGVTNNIPKRFDELSQVLISVTGPDSIGLEVLVTAPGHTPQFMRVLNFPPSQAYVDYVEVRV